MGHQHQGRARDERDLAHEVRRDADPELVHVREALPRREARSPVHHHGAEPQRPPEAHERHGHVSAPHDQEDRGRRENLHEGPHSLEEKRARAAGAERLQGLGGEAAVEEGLAQRSLQHARVEHEQLGAVIGRLEPGEDGRPPPGRRMRPRALVEEERPIARAVEGHRLDEHLDGPAAGQPDLPGLLIAQVELEQAGQVLPEHLGRLLDDLGVHAAADGDRSEDPAALADQHLRAFFPGGRAAGVHERRQRDLALRLAEPLDVLEELAHAGLT